MNICQKSFSKFECHGSIFQKWRMSCLQCSFNCVSSQFKVLSLWMYTQYQNWHLWKGDFFSMLCHFFMERLKNEQRLTSVWNYRKNLYFVKNVYSLLRPYYGPHNRPGESTILAVSIKFLNKFTLLVDEPLSCMRIMRTEENIASGYFLLGYAESFVYVDKPNTIEALQAEQAWFAETRQKCYKNDENLDLRNELLNRRQNFRVIFQM